MRDVNIELLTGASADALLDDAAFCGRWTALMDHCPWTTACQSPAFARAWYRSYKRRFEPLFAVSRDAAGELQGMLLLALGVKEDALVNVGAHQAEYHTWICNPDIASTFPAAALKAVRPMIPSGGLQFRYLPSGVPLHGLRMVPNTLIKAHRRPFMKLGTVQELDDLLNASSTRRNTLRRLRKQGRVEFRKLTTPAEVREALDQIILYYDARRMAVNGIAPFEEDPYKRAFYMAAAAEPGLLHMTVLMVDDHVAAAQVGMCQGGQMTPWLNPHNPFFSEFSPGKYHVLFLAKMLREEGYDEIDLTAGGDAYKERFANSWDHVHTFSVFASPVARSIEGVKSALKDMTKRTLTRMSIAPAAVQEKIEDLRRWRPIPAISNAADRGREWIGSTCETRVYVYERTFRPSKNGHATIEGVSRNSALDLMAYQAPNDGMSRRRFVAEAFARIERGQKLYTCLQDGKLETIGWLCDSPPKSLFAINVPGYAFPPSTACIPLLRTVAAQHGKAELTRCLRSMVQDALENTKTQRVVIVVPGDDRTMIQAVEAAGFLPERSLFEKVTFGSRKRWTVIYKRQAPRPVRNAHKATEHSWKRGQVEPVGQRLEQIR